MNAVAMPGVNPTQSLHIIRDNPLKIRRIQRIRGVRAWGLEIGRLTSWKVYCPTLLRRRFVILKVIPHIDIPDVHLVQCRLSSCRCRKPVIQGIDDKLSSAITRVLLWVIELLVLWIIITVELESDTQERLFRLEDVTPGIKGIGVRCH